MSTRTLRRWSEKNSDTIVPPPAQKGSGVAVQITRLTSASNAWQGFLPFTTLLPPLRLLITVTFSTPTGDYTHNRRVTAAEATEGAAKPFNPVSRTTAETAPALNRLKNRVHSSFALWRWDLG
ncbi:MAG: hypothetical protein DMG85_18030 [Acidobacteria bacterium]|nr:MAG: hypothetical protein DMG85_18030 [Acidobacteriota bacterium]